MTVFEKQTKKPLLQPRPIRDPHSTKIYPRISKTRTKTTVGTSIPKSTRIRVYVFCDQNNYSNPNKGVEEALNLVAELTEFVLVINRIFDMVIREKDHNFLHWNKENSLTPGQRKILRYGANKSFVVKREDRTRVRINKANQGNVYLNLGVHRRLTAYKKSHQLESLGHAVNTLLDRIWDLSELILVLKRIYETASGKEDYREIQFGFNSLMSLDLRILFNQILRGEEIGQK